MAEPETKNRERAQIKWLWAFQAQASFYFVHFVGIFPTLFAVLFFFFFFQFPLFYQQLIASAKVPLRLDSHAEYNGLYILGAFTLKLFLLSEALSLAPLFCTCRTFQSTKKECLFLLPTIVIRHNEKNDNGLHDQNSLIFYLRFRSV